jgi:tetratricopeptide (TPR) repeat protein
MFGWFAKKSKQIVDPLNLETALDCFRKGKFKEALQRADAIIQTGPEVALSWRFKGECLFSLERYCEAANCFAKSESIGGPGTEDIFLWKALSLYNGGERESAKRVVRDFLASGPENDELRDQAQNALRQFGVST